MRVYVNTDKPSLVCTAQLAEPMEDMLLKCQRLWLSGHGRQRASTGKAVWLLQGLLSLGLEEGLSEGCLCFGCVLSGVLFYLISVVRSYLMVFCFKGKHHGSCCFHHIKHITTSP